MMQKVNTEEVGQDASLDVKKDAAGNAKPMESLLPTAMQSTVPAVSVSAPIQYFTEGEMLPWKGKWWKVRLLEINGERIIGLVMQKDTDSALKRAERRQRWTREHPHAVAPRA